MSCRSTPLSSAITSYARRLAPEFSDTQVQSLYHQLKRELGEDDIRQPTIEEYHSAADRFISQIRHNPDLSDSQKESLLNRLESAKNSEPIDSRSWTALNSLQGVVESARTQYKTILENTARTHKVDPSTVHEWVREARGGSWMSRGGFVDYEDYPMEYRFDLVPGLPKDEATGKALRKLGYETFLAQPYPVFVYGTLRQGQGNNRVVSGGAQQYAYGELRGIGIYGAGRGFPYAAEHESDYTKTRGEIIWLSDDIHGEQARQGMDWLEGFNSDNPMSSHYERRLHVATDKGSGEPVKVWVYLARGSAKSQLQERDRIVHGDWIQAREEYRDPSYIRSRLLGL
jgi:gamma-glutamylcyclotransferase (GGCT)/AIG2-like uncharacterized protein YtfP